MTMIQVNIADAMARLSEYLDRLYEGEVVLICRRNVPIAELRRLPERTRGPRQFGGYKGKVFLHPSFFDPLPEDEFGLWVGDPG